MKASRFDRFISPAAAAGVFLTAANAGDGTWTNTATSGTWSNAGNWSGATVADGAGFTASFSSDITATTTVTLDSSRNIGNLVFSDNGASGSAWSLASSGGSALALGSGSSITTTTNASIGAALTAASGFTKLGAGTLTLTGSAGGIAGSVNVNAGILESTVERLGTATIHANSSYGAGYSSGGSPFLRITNTSNQILANDIVVAAPGSTSYYALQKSGVGSTLELSGTISGGNANSVLQLDTASGGDATTHFLLSGNNSIAGQIRLNRGRLTLGHTNALGSASLFLQTNANATNGNLAFASGITGVSNNIIIGTTTNQWIHTGAADITLSGVVSSATSGSGGFSKMGSGKLILSGANTYNGSTTTIADGTLSIAGSGRLHSGTYTGALVLNSSTSVFEHASSANQSLSGVISGSGSLVKSGSGTLTLNGTTANTYSGGTTISGGTLLLGTGGTGSNTSHVGALGTGDVAIGTGGTLRLWIQNSNTFTIANNLSIDGGRLLNEDGVYNMTGTVAVGASGATFSANYSNKTLTLSNTISGSGPVTISNGPSSTGGTVIFTGNNDYSGGTTVSSGTLGLGSNTAAGTGEIALNAAYGTSYITAGKPALMTTVSGLNIANNLNVSSTAGYYALQMGAATGGSVEWSGIIGGGGAGVVLQIDTPNSGGDSTSTATLSGDNTFAGQVRLNRGRLILGHANALGTADLFLQTNANATNGNLAFASGVTGISNNIIIGTTANQWINTGAADITLSGVITSGGGSFSKLGTGKLTLTGANTYTGSTTVANGTLAIAGSGRIHSAAYAGNLALSSATSVLDYGSSSDQAISGVISGSGSLVKSGASTLTLSGNNTYTGATTVNGGTLAIAPAGSITSTVTVNHGGTLAGGGTITGHVTVKSGGTHAIGASPGVQTVNGTATYEDGSIFAWDLASSASSGTGTRGADYDGLNAANIDAQSGSIFRVILADTPLADIQSGISAFWTTTQFWDDIFAGTFAGNFPVVQVFDTANVNITSAISTYGSFSTSGGILTWSAVPEPGSALAGLLLGAGLWRRRR